MYAITLYCIEKSKSGTREGSYRFAKMQKSEQGSNSQQGKLVAVECSGKHYKKSLTPPRSEQQNEKATEKVMVLWWLFRFAKMFKTLYTVSSLSVENIVFRYRIRVSACSELFPFAFRFS